MVHVVAYFGFTASGSSDDARERHITTAISPTYAQQILQLQASGATEEELHPVVAQAVTESYCTEWGTRADGLRADFAHVQSMISSSDTTQLRGCSARFHVHGPNRDSRHIGSTVATGAGMTQGRVPRSQPRAPTGRGMCRGVRPSRYIHSLQLFNDGECRHVQNRLTRPGSRVGLGGPSCRRCPCRDRWRRDFCLQPSGRGQPASWGPPCLWGTLISPTTVLTSASCISGSDLQVRAHVHDLGLSDAESGGSTTKVKTAHRHPDFDAGTGRNDVAVLILEGAVPDAQPAALPAAGSATPQGTELLLAGWGATTQGGALSRVLNSVTVATGDPAACATAYELDGPGVLCIPPDEGKGACTGDTGGPAFTDGVLRAIQTVPGCGRPGQPTALTAVSQHREFIDRWTTH
ncbi:hypothetical protein SMICM304S_00973 [Streptomyces microflavus]